MAGIDPFAVVKQFEAALCEYTNAPFCVTTTSCTSALLLATSWALDQQTTRWHGKEFVPPVDIPKRTYVGVGMAVMHAGGTLIFRDEDWETNGYYQLKPLPVWDYARLLTYGMYAPGQMQCLSFHPAKHLGLTVGGGAILLDDPDADRWLRKARFDGRTEGVAPADDTFDVLGWHAYMEPATAAEGLRRLSLLPKHNEPLPWDNYADLSQIPLFR